MYKERLQQIFDNEHPRTHMSETQTMIMVKIMLANDHNLTIPIDEIDKNSETYQQFKPLFGSSLIKVFLIRLTKMANLKITLGALMILAQYFGTFGSVVICSYYLFHKLPKNTIITSDIIATDLFPWGFFSTEQINKIWQAQKVVTDENLDECHCIGVHDNFLDYVECWVKEENI